MAGELNLSCRSAATLGGEDRTLFDETYVALRIMRESAQRIGVTVAVVLVPGSGSEDEADLAAWLRSGARGCSGVPGAVHATTRTG